MDSMDSKKLVWLINYTGKKGGGPLDAISMTRGLINNGEKVVAVISSGVENINEWKKLNLLKLVIIDTYMNKLELLTNSLFFSMRQGKQISKKLENIHIDIVYCPMVTFWTESINRLFSKAVKIEVLHDPIPHSGEKGIISLSVERQIKRADIIVVHSEKFIDYVEKKYMKKTISFPLGRHSEYSKIEKRDKGFDYESGKISFLFFGTLSKYKGLNILAEAYKKVEDCMGKDACALYIVGAGDFTEYEDSYKEISNCVIINEWIPDEEVESYFQGNNLVCVCPYIDGTQSGAVMLALEYQIPVIATDVGGISEQIVNGKTGIIISPNNVDELSDAMIMLAKNESMRERMMNNQKKDLKRFDWNNIAKTLIDIVYEN